MGEYERILGVSDDCSLQDLISVYLKRLESLVNRAKNIGWKGFIHQGSIFRRVNDAFIRLYNEKFASSRRDPDYEKAGEVFKKGKERYYKNDYREAADHFQRAIGFSKRHTYYGFLGLAFKKMKSYDSAVKAFQEAIKLYPTSRDYWMNLGDIYQEAGQKEKALESYASAYLVDPSDTKPLERMDEIDPEAFILKKKDTGDSNFGKFVKRIFKKKF